MMWNVKRNVSKPIVAKPNTYFRLQKYLPVHANGFSLIELMVALAITGLFAIIMIRLLASVTNQTSSVKDVSDISSTSRTSLFIMARDIANAGYMLNCVGRACGSILVTPNPAPITGVAPTNCAFSGVSSGIAPCNAVVYSNSPVTLTLNYGALSNSDPIQVKYSIYTDTVTGKSSLRREETHAITASYPKYDSYIANNIVAMAFLFGIDTGNTGTVTYSATVNNMSQLRSIKFALITISDLPDKKYNAPSSISWLGGTYTVPAGMSHYRFKVMQQEVFLINHTLTSP